MNSISQTLGIASFLPPVLGLGLFLLLLLKRSNFIQRRFPSLRPRGGFWADLGEIILVIWLLWACIAIGLILAAASLIIQPGLLGLGALVFNIILAYIFRK
jgi:hypothetical protein